MFSIFIIILLFLLVVIFVPCITIVPQAKAYVIERLGAYQGTWDVGFHIKLPVIDRVAKRVNLKEKRVIFDYKLFSKFINSEKSKYYNRKHETIDEIKAYRKL